MQGGRRINESTPLNEIRLRTLENYARLPKPMTTLEVVPAYPVEISASLQALAKHLDEAQSPDATIWQMQGPSLGAMQLF